jgi:hypothetical protein
LTDVNPTNDSQKLNFDNLQKTTYKDMKFKNLLFAVSLVAFTMIATHSFAQTEREKKQTQINDDQTKIDVERNAKRQNDADALDQEYKDKANEAAADAKEANRINKDAVDAAKQAKKSARLEKKAQKARTRAEKQVEKANKAATKSDNN